MNLNPSIPTITNSVSLIFKIGILSIIFLFLIFLLVVLKQLRAMNIEVSQPELFPILQFLNLLLILATIFLFLLGVVIL